MLKKVLAAVCIVTLGVVTNVSARNTRAMYSVKDALANPKVAEVVDPDIRLYFGDASHPQVKQSLGTYTSNKKTNAFNKSDLVACQWAFSSAVKSLQERAAAEGGNAVIKIVSYYKKKKISSATEFECAAGNVIAGVALRGEVVKF